MSQQGHLDSLCGVYSIINAIVATCYPNNTTRNKVGSNDFKEQLYASLIKVLERKQELANTILEGMDGVTLVYCIEHAIEFTSEKLNATLIYETSNVKRISSLVPAIKKTISIGGCVLIGLSGTHEHWTVVDKCTDKRITFTDSGNLKHIDLENATCGTTTKQPHRILEAYHIFEI